MATFQLTFPFFRKIPPFDRGGIMANRFQRTKRLFCSLGSNGIFTNLINVDVEMHYPCFSFLLWFNFLLLDIQPCRRSKPRSKNSTEETPKRESGKCNEEWRTESSNWFHFIRRHEQQGQYSFAQVVLRFLSYARFPELSLFYCCYSFKFFSYHKFTFLLSFFANSAQTCEQRQFSIIRKCHVISFPCYKLRSTKTAPVFPISQLLNKFMYRVDCTQFFPSMGLKKYLMTFRIPLGCSIQRDSPVVG